MPEGWQILAAAAGAIAVAAWFAWVRMRDAADAWVSAWHYWPSRKAETRAAYDGWRRTVVVLALAATAVGAGAAMAYARRDPAATAGATAGATVPAGATRQAP